MTQAEQRQIAIRAARAALRQMGIDPTTVDAAGAFCVLDDLSRVEPDLVASRWHAAASDNQQRLFIQEWGQFRAQAKGLT
jgi:hypothetical protein